MKEMKRVLTGVLTVTEVLTAKVSTVVAVVLMLGAGAFGVNVFAAGDLTVGGKVEIGTGALDPGSSKVSIFTGGETYNVPGLGDLPLTGLSVESDGIAIYAKSTSPNRPVLSASSPTSSVIINAQIGEILSALRVSDTNNSTFTKFAGEFISQYGTAGYFSNNPSSSKPVLLAYGGNIGFGTFQPDVNYRLHVVGDILADNFIQSSDEKYKKNISPIESPLAKILNLRGVAYEWDTEKYQDRGFSEGGNYGVIAQEVEKVLPEIVKEGKASGKAVSYTQIIPVLIEAVKEQQQTINKLKAQQVVIMDQQKTMAEMSEKLVRLERQMQLKNSVVMIDTVRP